MSPTHTRRNGKLYRYYIAMDVLKRGAEPGPASRLAAGDVERAVVDQLRAILRAPEIVVRTWRKARPKIGTLTEAEVREALEQLDPLWDELFPAEQARIVQLLVERVDVAQDGIRDPAPHERHRCPRTRDGEAGRVMEDDRTVTVRIPLVFRKHGGRKAVISPDGQARTPGEPLVDRALVRALARAFRWQRLLDEGEHATFDELAKAEGVSQSHVSRMLRLTLLAPNLVEAIMAGLERIADDVQRLGSGCRGNPLRAQLPQTRQGPLR